MNDTPQARMGELIALAAQSGALKKAVFSKPDDPELQRTVITLRRIGGRVMAQAESLRTDNKAMHENIPAENAARFTALAEGFGQVNLITTVGSCELRRSKSGNRTLLGGENLRKALQKDDAPTAAISSNNRQKSYILSGKEPFLRLLDVSDENGRVRD